MTANVLCCWRRNEDPFTGPQICGSNIHLLNRDRSCTSNERQGTCRLTGRGGRQDLDALLLVGAQELLNALQPHAGIDQLAHLLGRQK